MTSKHSTSLSSAGGQDNLLEFPKGRLGRRRERQCPDDHTTMCGGDGVVHLRARCTARAATLLVRNEADFTPHGDVQM